MKEIKRKNKYECGCVSGRGCVCRRGVRARGRVCVGAGFVDGFCFSFFLLKKRLPIRTISGGFFLELIRRFEFEFRRREIFFFERFEFLVC